MGERMNQNQISLEDFIDYEIAGSPWSWLTPHWAERIVGAYFGRKAERKYRRYAAAQRIEAMMSLPKDRSHWAVVNEQIYGYSSALGKMVPLDQLLPSDFEVIGNVPSVLLSR